MVELLLRVMWSGCRVTAGHVNDATCVCDEELLRGAMVQVKSPSGSYPLVPVTANTTPPPPDILTCTLPLWVRVTGEKKKRTCSYWFNVWFRCGSERESCFTVRLDKFVHFKSTPLDTLFSKYCSKSRQKSSKHYMNLIVVIFIYKHK